MYEERGRIVNDFPTPIAYTYSLIFDGPLAASIRRWALCYCEYQLLRTVALPLVGQYLRPTSRRSTSFATSRPSRP